MKGQFGGRASGKTLRLAKDARPGDVLVVSHQRDALLLRQALSHEGLRPQDYVIIPIDEDKPADRLRGLPRDRRVYIDHGVYNLWSDDHCGRAAHDRFTDLMRIAEERFGGIHSEPVKEPCDTGRAESTHSGEAPRAGVHGG